MALNKNDCVYISSRGVYGRISGICKVMGMVFYEVDFNGTFSKKLFFDESELIKLEVPDFKEGDIVTGLKGANAYVVTTDKAIMEVLGVKEDSMEVKILSHETRPRGIGSYYTVAPIWFKLVRPRTNFYRGEKED